MYPVIMHVNYCEQGQSIRDICAVAARLGFAGVEFRRKRSGVDETPAAYLDEIARWTREFNHRYVLFGGPGINAMSSDPNVVRREVDDYKSFLTLAADRVPLSVINIMTGPLVNPAVEPARVAYHLHGSAYATSEQWESAAAACREIADFAKPTGVKFAFETHMYYLHDLAETARKLCDLIDRDNFGVNLDYGNTQYFTSRVAPLEEAVKICGEKLFYTHFKNSCHIPRLDTPDARFLIPSGLGEGAINHRAYVKALKGIGFDGLIGIEAPRPGDREWFAAQDIHYIKSVLKDLED
ncbi:MAG: sugar phosphate isomerase/epimerase family protein [Eubacteriales bacterium]|jgi:sugar phosphate isomerase/epimerase